MTVFKVFLGILDMLRQSVYIKVFFFSLYDV